MPSVRVNGVTLFYEASGAASEPLVLVHGSWGDHHNWDAVVPALSRAFRVVTYDRRGHSLSERPQRQGSIVEDVDDLAALIETLRLAPAHIAGNSGGAAVVLRLAATRPDLFRTLIVHEPALFGLLASIPEASAAMGEVRQRIDAVVQLLEAGDDEGGARRFVDTIAFGPGSWEKLPEETRRTFIRNAPTFLDETRDPQSLQFDLASLSRFPSPALVTHGTTSAPFFPIVARLIARALPRATEDVFAGAGHLPHLTHPAEYVDRIKAFASGRALTPPPQP